MAPDTAERGKGTGGTWRERGRDAGARAAAGVGLKRPPPAPRVPAAPPAILYYHDTVGMYGTKRYSLDLLQALRGLGLRVRAHPAWSREVRIAGRPVGGLVTKHLAALVPVWGRGVLHATYHNFQPRLRRCDVVTVHDLIPILRPDLASGGERRGAADERNLRRALAADPEVIAVSRATREDLLRHAGADPSRVHAVHHGVHHERFYPEAWPAGTPSPFQPGRLNVLAAMNADLRKRLDLLLEAARDLPFVRIVQVGKRQTTPYVASRLAGLRGLEDELERQGRYVALDHVGDDELRRLYANADLVAHPSAAEGFSLPPLEALACGAPVAVSDIPVHREVLGDAARFVPQDADAWARLFQEAWDGQRPRAAAFPPRAARLAHAARFTWEEAARRTAAVYALRASRA